MFLLGAFGYQIHLLYHIFLAWTPPEFLRIKHEGNFIFFFRG